MNRYRYCQHHTGLLAQAARSLAAGRALPATAAICGTSAFHSSAPRENRSYNKNYYEKLGLTKDATKKEIKSQFYKLSKMHHPDKTSSEESRQAFLAINEAYSVLGDDRQRRDYDLSFLDKSGTLYSNASSSQRSTPSRGTLRRTPFRHSAQSAAAAAAARAHAAFRPQYFKENVAHFDSKSHQEMHYEQDIRREERRQARQRASAEYQRQQEYDNTNTATSKFLRVSFILLAVMLSSSLVKAFADEGNDEEDSMEPLLHSPKHQQHNRESEGPVLST